MRNYISEGRAVYEDYNHGQFSKRLAERAIGNMKVADPTTGKLKALQSVTLSEVKEILKDNKVKLPDGTEYTAWYLYNMALADYPKALKTDESRAAFVEETICDPDCNPCAVLECFTAKMCCMNQPIFWENYL
jgi:hypothetical protein